MIHLRNKARAQEAIGKIDHAGPKGVRSHIALRYVRPKQIALTRLHGIIKALALAVNTFLIYSQKLSQSILQQLDRYFSNSAATPLRIIEIQVSFLILFALTFQHRGLCKLPIVR